MAANNLRILFMTTAVGLALGAGAAFAQSGDPAVQKQRPAASAVDPLDEATKKIREGLDKGRASDASVKEREAAESAKRKAKEAAAVDADSKADEAAAKAKAAGDSAEGVKERTINRSRDAVAPVTGAQKPSGVGRERPAASASEDPARRTDRPAGGAVSGAPGAKPDRDGASPRGDDKPKRVDRSRVERTQPDVQTLEAVRSGRRERVEDGRTIIVEPDRRQIIRDGNRITIIHDETERLRRSSRDIRVEQGDAGVTRTIISRQDGTRIINVVDADGRTIRRVRETPDGRSIVMFDNGPRRIDERARSDGDRGRASGRRDGARWRGDAFVELEPPQVRIPRERYIVEMQAASPEQVIEVLEARPIAPIKRRYTLQEIQQTENIRAHMPRIDLNTITFETGSWEIPREYAQRLEVVAKGMRRVIDKNAGEIFLIEGHTDAVGSNVDNLTLSDRRAESVAEALTNVFDVPPENLTTQGFGEEHLKVQTEAPERANRRVTIRRITPLLQGSL